jgi:hypothetical protein
MSSRFPVFFTKRRLVLPSKAFGGEDFWLIPKAGLPVDVIAGDVQRRASGSLWLPCVAGCTGERAWSLVRGR